MPTIIMTNFTRMHNNYLDPDKHINNWCDDEEEGVYDDVIYDSDLTLIEDYMDESDYPPPPEWDKYYDQLFPDLSFK